MIKMSDISEASNKTDVSEKFKNIKPIEKMTDLEADDFWTSEFEKAQDETEMDPYDRLLSEVFNRSEDELAIEFDIDDKILSVIERFKPENWDAMNESHKLSALKELAQTLGEKLGLDNIPSISLYEESGGSFGDYDPSNNVISLNKSHFTDSREVVNTLTHELRHAFQHLRAEVLDTWEDALFRVNFDNYISPVSLPGGGWLFITDYLDQYVEVDARVFANLFTEAMKV